MRSLIGSHRGYPDLIVKLDRLEPKGERVLYHWTFIGTNTRAGSHALA